MSLKKTIKDYIKKNYSIDIVLIQCGCFFEVVEEDSLFFKNKFNFNVHGVKTKSTGFYIKSLKKYIDELEFLNVNYCVIEQIDKSDNSKNIYREITHSNKKNCIGIKFIGKKLLTDSNIKQNKNSNEVIKSKIDYDNLIEKNKNNDLFFKIENYKKNLSINPLKLRKQNIENNRLLNSGFPFYEEEINMIKKMFKDGRTIKELEIFFQRKSDSIFKIINCELD